MRLSYSAEDEAFRSEFVAWLAENLPADNVLHTDKLSSAWLPEFARDWQRKLFADGWLVPGWSPEYGGRNATASQQMIYFEELSKQKIPRTFNPQALGIIAPSIRDYGTDAQRERFVLPTLRAEISWCLGMSEPGAGSDLASLKTRAVLDGDRFIVNGQKVWTSGAHHADWCLCFVRTDPDVPKHKGISALLIDMKSPGVECRPFPELSDNTYTDFNEVFFTDVEVPVDQLLGELHRGWPITQGSLAHERSMLWIDYAYDLQRVTNGFRMLGDRIGPNGTRLGDDPKFRDAVAGFHVDSMALMAMGYRGFSKFMAGKSSSEHSLLKLYGSERIQQCVLAASEYLGPDAVDLDAQGFRLWRDGAWMIQYLRSFSGTLPGGTSEIQRNIIAERVLGLPRA